MRIGLINPNATQSMTDAMARTARDVVAAGTEILPFTAKAGPTAIESYVDEAYATTQVLDILRTENTLDGYIIACASDPGLLAARELVTASVVGIGEAAFLYATTLAPRFGVLTTMDRAIEQIWRQLASYGLHTRCCSVRASGIGVLETVDPAEQQVRSLIEVIQAMVRKDGAEAVVLGCGGMSETAEQLQEEAGIPVIDGVRAAATLVEGLVRCRLKTSKHRTLAPPIEVAYIADGG